MPRILARYLSGCAHRGLRLHAVPKTNPLEKKASELLRDASAAANPSSLPCMHVPRRKGGKSLAELVSEGRR